MSEIKGYKDLKVWQKSMTLVADVYKLTKGFPSEENFGLTSQIRRSSVSIPSNIAEGFGRRSKGDYIRFLKIAVGSLYEVQTQLEISKMLEYVQLNDYNTIYDRTKELDRMFGSLVRNLN